MADSRGRFYWGILVGGVVGFLLGRYLSSDQGREQLESLKARTIELTGDPEEIKQKAQAAASNVSSAVGDALQEGIAAAKQRRAELTAKARELGEAATPAPAPTPTIKPAPTTGAEDA